MGAIHRLSPLKVQNAKVGKHCDGGGLWLVVIKGSDGGLRRRWVYRWTVKGRERHHGLGSTDTVDLAGARDAALACRRLVRNGGDPIAARQERMTAKAIAAKPVLTFKQVAQQYIDAHDSSWRSASHRYQWAKSLRQYVFPGIGDLPVSAVDTDAVLQVLRPIWNEKTESAARIRGRIEVVLDAAKTLGLRHGENPARWKGHLAHLLPSRAKLAPKEHYAALPYAELPGFLAKLRLLTETSARALEFCILTAARTGEVIGARWNEIVGDVWVIPRERTKALREHRVPLCERALEILAGMREVRASEFVFAGRDNRRPIGKTLMCDAMNRLGYLQTVHGMRSAFRDWAGAETNFPREVCEMALAHRVGDATEQAYARGDLFWKRKELMAAWGRYCTTSPSEVAAGAAVS
jgi:integrase